MTGPNQPRENQRGDRAPRSRRQRGSRRDGSGPARRSNPRPPLKVFTTTLWDYPSQHYDSTLSKMQGDRDYSGATPSWIIWQLLQRYTREKDLIVDPMAGSGTTIDVARDLNRRALGYDLAPTRPDIFRADARSLPLEDSVADFVFIDPPYSTHINYSDSPACIGKLDAGGADHGAAYYQAMSLVIAEMHRVLKNRRYCALYVSDSWKKKRTGSQARGEGDQAGSPSSRPTSDGGFMAIGFELFNILRGHFVPIDIIAVVRHNAKLQQGNFHKAAREHNFFLRGFNYLFIMKKVNDR